MSDKGHPTQYQYQLRNMVVNDISLLEGKEGEEEPDPAMGR